MNDISFSHSFMFRTIEFDKFHYTDSRTGAPSHYFAYMLCGSCKIVTDTETVHISEGDIFYIPDKCGYQSYWYGNPEIRFVSLGFLCMPNFENKSYPVQVIPHSDKASELFHLLSDKTRLSPADIGVFYTLAGILIPLMTDVAVCRTREITQRTKEYLIQHPFAKTSELAKNCAVSEAALYSAFKKASDVTLNRLRNNLLLEKAKDILISTDKPIEYISDVLHFSSTSYFRKKFKQHFNMTPTEMRKRYRI
jgi:AraC-like DNA-binding protein